MSVTRLAWPAATLAVAAAVLLSLAVGTRPVPPSAVLDALLHGGSSPDALVVRSLRLPRTEIGLTAGAALGVAGAALQAVTRNPLADPGILGLSQGAAAGVVLAIATGLASGFSGYVWYAFAGAVLAACLVYGIAARGRGGASPVKLALAGTALSAMTAGGTTVVLTSSSATLDQFRFWQVGSLSGRDADTVVEMLPFLVAGALLVLVCARGLDALALGDETARALGHRVGSYGCVRRSGRPCWWRPRWPPPDRSRSSASPSRISPAASPPAATAACSRCPPCSAPRCWSGRMWRGGSCAPLRRCRPG